MEQLRNRRAGIVPVGMAPAKDLLALAKKADVDVLITFDVSVSANHQTGQVTNTTKIQVYNVANGKREYVTKPLNNVRVRMERTTSKSRSTDPVDTEIKRLFKYIDGNWQLVELPTSILPEHVIDRISTLIGEFGDDPLSELAEIRMYQTRGLLSDRHLVLAYQKILGDKRGTMLATGQQEARKQVIKEWLPARP